MKSPPDTLSVLKNDIPKTGGVTTLYRQVGQCLLKNQAYRIIEERKFVTPKRKKKMPWQKDAEVKKSNCARLRFFLYTLGGRMVRPMKGKDLISMVLMNDLQPPSAKLTSGGRYSATELSMKLNQPFIELYKRDEIVSAKDWYSVVYKCLYKGTEAYVVELLKFEYSRKDNRYVCVNANRAKRCLYAMSGEFICFITGDITKDIKKLVVVGKPK